jgi:hypothetical protein
MLRAGPLNPARMVRFRSTSGSLRGRSSDVMKRLLLDSKVGTSGIGHVQIQNSFRKGHYSLSTGLDVSEWQVLFEEFFAMRIIVKSEAKSD